MNKLVYWMVFPTFLAIQPLSDSSQSQIPLTSDSSYTSQIGTQNHFFVSIPSNPNVYQPIVTYSDPELRQKAELIKEYIIKNDYDSGIYQLLKWQNETITALKQPKLLLV